ncbi:hypothetical protein NC652_025526 [Populus alba x Populus x berolinensis]|nr:hypothetical protein NC652_025526 [Populus alba x Populus x berolinensis]
MASSVEAETPCLKRIRPPLFWQGSAQVRSHSAMMVRKAATQIKKHKNKHELTQNGLSCKRKIASERTIKSEASTEIKLQKTIGSGFPRITFSFPATTTIQLKECSITVHEGRIANHVGSNNA